MSNQPRIVVIGVLGCAVVMSAMASRQQDTRARVKAASSVLLAPAGPVMTQATIVKALSDLLEAVVDLSARLPHGPEIEQRVDVARNLLEETSLFNEKARQYLSFAHRLLTNGQKYEKPKDLDQFVTMEEAQAKSRAYCSTLATNALAAIDHGRTSEAATLLLQLVLAVITPMSGEPASVTGPCIMEAAD